MQGFRSPTGRDRCKGEFGTAVAAAAEDLPAASPRLLAAPKPDAVALSQAVRARFGPALFRARVGMAPEGSWSLSRHQSSFRVSRESRRLCCLIMQVEFGMWRGGVRSTMSVAAPFV
jgi:hypothetical protein